MASFLDITFFRGITPILILLLVFAIVYGILSTTKFLGNNKNLNAIIALVIGIFVMFSTKIVKVIMVMIPWFLILGIFLILVVIAFKTLGLSDESLRNAVHDKTVYWTITIICLILFVASIASVFGQQELNVTKQNSSSQITFSSGDNSGTTSVDSNGNVITNTDNFQNNAKATFYHPRMLGFLVVIVICVFAAIQLTKN